MALQSFSFFNFSSFLTCVCFMYRHTGNINNISKFSSLSLEKKDFYSCVIYYKNVEITVNMAAPSMHMIDKGIAYIILSIYGKIFCDNVNLLVMPC